MKKIIFVFVTSLALTGCLNGSQGSNTSSPDSPVNKGSAPPTPTPTTTPNPTATPTPTPTQAADWLQQQVQFYKQRYGLRDPYTKLVDNTGDGYDALYGARNVRVVLNGIYYRGGANNSYNKNGKRRNENPLPTAGLQNFCEEGFTDAVYLYPDNYSTAPTSVSCRGPNNEDSTLKYSQITGLTLGNEVKLLTLIYDHIKGTRKGPMYAHCWNGWHSSGFVAAIALKQFCGWSGTDADNYWVKNTDGNSAGMDSIRTRIRNFQPIASLKITPAEQELICP